MGGVSQGNVTVEHITVAGAGDKDAQDSVAMLESNKLRDGKLTQSAFVSGGNSKQTIRKKNDKSSGSSGKKARRIGMLKQQPSSKLQSSLISLFVYLTISPWIKESSEI